MIRLYSTSDLEAVHAMGLEIIQRSEYPAVLKDGSLSALEESLSALSASPHAIVLVSENNGIIDGVLAATLGTFLWNDEYLIAKDLLFASNRHGSELMDVYVEWARDNGAVLIMGHCSSGDPRAERFYEKRGAKRLGSIWEISHG